MGDPEPLQKIDAHHGYVLRCKFSPDTSMLATAGSDQAVKLWSVPDFRLQRTLVGHQRWVWDCVFSADSSLVITGSSDHSVRLWDVKQGESSRQYNGHHKAVVAIALTDGEAQTEA